MKKRSLTITIIVLFALSLFLAPAALAQGPGGAASKDKVLSDESAPPKDDGSAPPQQEKDDPQEQDAPAGAAGIPAAELPQMGPSVSPHGINLYYNPHSFEKRAAFLAGLTTEQRAQIKALYEANQPTHFAEIASALEADAAISKAELQSLNEAGLHWLSGIEAGMQNILTEEQYALYQQTDLPKPTSVLISELSAGDVSSQSQNDCAVAYNLLIEVFNTYAYWAMLNAQAAYFAGDDIYAFTVYALLYDNWAVSYYGALNAYYAYWNYYNSNYAYPAFYYARHSEGFSLHGYQLAYTMNSWTSSYSSYAYYAAVYGEAAYNNYNGVADDYAWNCYAN